MITIWIPCVVSLIASAVAIWATVSTRRTLRRAERINRQAVDPWR